ncbi:hypothetical protein PV11_02669 [Exophiala sideris]|uniref:Mif2/CENP-C cupin domain-containing protein n=1 Tax=Exophiala sideris TaxID=1016849 RepID=A0A0D1YZZ6_9EURO|nr:hypothetical protein PV11_02669 [Exophiala sideris]
MAPRPPAHRERDNVDYSAVGKLGRRTGVTLEPRPLDANGMEEITGIFSSPRKPSPLKNVIVMESVEETNLSATPAQSLRRSTRSTPRRPPRSSSPRKSGISGTARKSNGVDIFSTRKSVRHGSPDDDGNAPATTPTQQAPAHTPRISNGVDVCSSRKSLRHEDLEDSENVPEMTPTQQAHARTRTPSPNKSPLRDITTTSSYPNRPPRPSMSEIERAESEVSAMVEEESLQPNEETAQEEEETIPEPDDYLPNGGDDEPEEYVPNGGDDEQVMSLEKQREEPEDPSSPPKDFDDEEVDETFEPEPSLPPVLQNQPNSRRKRKSDVLEVDEEAAISPVPQKALKTNEKQPLLAENSPRLATSSKAQPSKAGKKQALKHKDPNVKMSARQEKELDDIIEKVKARPGPPRSLYILRRETPADEGVTHTRSGRVSIKPLAYWRNERCVYGENSPLPKDARYPLNSIKEIVRTEEVNDSWEKPKSKKKRKNAKGKEKEKGKARAVPVVESDSSDSDVDEDEGPKEDPYAEPWETEGGGKLRGNVSIWDGAEQAPLEQEEEIEIAYAATAIKTREVKKGSSPDGRPTFRYAKLISTKFMGSGLLDLPPGGLKRPKNSRMMHMSFFVVKGRVTVSVGPIGGEETGSTSRFSIGKGGFWQVPRGNQYSIENELDKPAQIFFSQGCEPLPAEFEE